MSIKPMDRRYYRGMAKDQGRVYYEYALDAVGGSGLTPVGSMSSVGTLSPENAQLLRKVLEAISHSEQRRVPVSGDQIDFIQEGLGIQL